MAPAFAALCASHSPFANMRPEVDRGFLDTMGKADGWVGEFAPELVIQFSPDHFNGMFYDAMPSFCVAAAAESVGDWQTPAGALNVPSGLAMELLDAVRASDIDAALSHRLPVDHGTTQLWSLMTGELPSHPIIPIIINCAAPPRPSLRRCRLLGKAVGRFAAGIGKRILFSASGGLSHDPPIPAIAGAEGRMREFLLSGRNLSAEARVEREARVIAGAERLVADGADSDILPPDAEWDAKVLDLLATGNLAAFDDWDDDEITRLGGCGGHEIRCWIAALAALRAAGGAYEMTVDHYAVAMEWMTGMAVAHATQH